MTRTLLLLFSNKKIRCSRSKEVAFTHNLADPLQAYVQILLPTDLGWNQHLLALPIEYSAQPFAYIFDTRNCWPVQLHRYMTESNECVEEQRSIAQMDCYQGITVCLWPESSRKRTER